MSELASAQDVRHLEGTPGTARTFPRVSLMALGMSLGLFGAVTFALCVAFDLAFPDLAMYPTWLRLLPGVTWLTWSSFFLGLAESFAYGWYVALIFGPLYNFFAARAR